MVKAAPCQRPLHALGLALPQTLMLDGLDADVARAFDRALNVLRDAGAQIEDLPLAYTAVATDIATGEEITANYGETHHEGQLKCRCGAPGCIGWL